MYSIKSASSCVDVRACNWASCSWGRCETNGLVVYFVCLLHLQTLKIFKDLQSIHLPANIEKKWFGKIKQQKTFGRHRQKTSVLAFVAMEICNGWPSWQRCFFAKLSNWNKGVSGYQYKTHPGCEVKLIWNKYPSWWLVSTHFKNMLLKLDHFPQNRHENYKKELQPPPRYARYLSPWSNLPLLLFECNSARVRLVWCQLLVQVPQHQGLHHGELSSLQIAKRQSWKQFQMITLYTLVSKTIYITSPATLTPWNVSDSWLGALSPGFDNSFFIHSCFEGTGSPAWWSCSRSTCRITKSGI